MSQNQSIQQSMNQSIESGIYSTVDKDQNTLHVVYTFFSAYADWLTKVHLRTNLYITQYA